MSIFECIFKNGVITYKEVFICLGVALLCGIIFSSMCFFRTKSTKSFLIATSILPMVVALVILLVNGNIGAGVAIAGAFSLVRFRSSPGTAKEISVIFIAMAAGLAFGMGYLGYGAIFMLITGIVLMIMEGIRIWDVKPIFNEKRIRITLPEDLDYSAIFDDIFEKYTTKYEVVRMQTTNLGSMFKVYYDVVMKNVKDEKDMVDEIRQRNGNLEVVVQRTDYRKNEL